MQYRFILTHRVYAQTGFINDVEADVCEGSLLFRMDGVVVAVYAPGEWIECEEIGVGPVFGDKASAALRGVKEKALANKKRLAQAMGQMVPAGSPGVEGSEEADRGR